MVHSEIFVRQPETLRATNFMVIVVGPTASGKDSVVNRFCNNYPWVRKITSYTTRQQRPKDIDGIDYHFISRQEFERRKKEFVFITEREIKGEPVFYGMAKDDLIAVGRGGATICHMDLGSLMQLPRVMGECVVDETLARFCMDRIVPIYIGVPRLTTLKGRYFGRHRADDEKTVFLERLRGEWHTWQKFKDQIPHTIMNVGPLDETVGEIVKLINKLSQH